MEFQYNLDSLVLSVKLENKKHIKHCYLRVVDGQIQIRANIYFTIEDAYELLNRKKKWLIKILEQSSKNSLKDDEFLYFGEFKKLSDFDIKNLDSFYKDEIKIIIPPLVEKYSKLMKLYPNSINYRKNKRTWGSCNYKNDLKFNTQLCKFPKFIAEYVVIHELAHIKHKNHSKKFWDLVNEFCPDYKQREKIFKTLL
ncbi:MAG: M48 family metallopeptidase [Poseidonibacter sp.]